jgi:hypothetical protein
MQTATSAPTTHVMRGGEGMVWLTLGSFSVWEPESRLVHMCTSNESAQHGRDGGWSVEGGVSDSCRASALSTASLPLKSPSVLRRKRPFFSYGIRALTRDESFPQAVRRHSTSQPTLPPLYQPPTAPTMADTHTASVDEANAARLPLGYRDQCSAYVPPLPTTRLAVQMRCRN